MNYSLGLLKSRQREMTLAITTNTMLILKGCRKVRYLGPCDEESFWGRKVKDDVIYDFKWDDIIRIIK